MQVVVHDGHDIIRNLTFEETPIRIGSSPECPVYLPDMRVSLQQAVLVPMPGGGWMIDPVDLTHKTLLNGRQIVSRTELEHGDEVLISNFFIKIYFEFQAKVAIERSVATEEIAKIRQYPLPPGAQIRRPKEPLTISSGAEVALARFAQELRDCVDIDRLMATTLQALRERFDARLVWFGARRQDYGSLEYVEGRTASGTTTVEPPNLERYSYRCLERTQFLLIPRTEEERTQSAMAVPLVSHRGRLGVLYVDSAPTGPAYDMSHLDLLTLYAAMASRQLEAVVEEQIRLQEVISAGELSFVREVQDRLDPTNVPQWEQLQFAVYCKPGLDHTGDVYDVMKMPNGLATFFVGHVRGEPTASALAMVEMRAAFRVASLHGDPPHVFLREVSWLLMSDSAECSAGCCAIVTNPRTGAAECATAGEIGAVVIDRCGAARDLADPASPPLGSVRNYAYRSVPLRLMPGETVVLYSPGCTLATDEAGQVVGRERLTEALCDGFGISASDALDNLLSDLSGPFKLGRQPDDITFVFVHRTEA